MSDVCASTSGNRAAAGNSSTSDNSSTCCIRTATIDTARIAATAILIVRITISSATGYNGSAADDRTAAIGGSTSDCDTTSSCATTISSTAASCATPMRATGPG